MSLMTHDPHDPHDGGGGGRLDGACASVAASFDEGGDACLRESSELSRAVVSRPRPGPPRSGVEALQDPRTTPVRESSLLFLLLMLGTVWLALSLYNFTKTSVPRLLVWTGTKTRTKKSGN